MRNKKLKNNIIKTLAVIVLGLTSITGTIIVKNNTIYAETKVEKTKKEAENLFNQATKELTEAEAIKKMHNDLFNESPVAQTQKDENYAKAELDKATSILNEKETKLEELYEKIDNKEDMLSFVELYYNGNYDELPEDMVDEHYVEGEKEWEEYLFEEISKAVAVKVEAEKEYNDAVAEYNSKKAEVNLLKTEYDTLTSIVKELESKRNAAQNEFDDAKSHYDMLNSQYGANGTDPALPGSVEEQELENARVAKDEVEAKLNQITQNDDYDAKKAELTAKENTFNIAKNELKVLEDKKVDADVKVQDADFAIKEAEEMYNEQKELTLDYETVIAEIKAEINDLKTNRNALSDEILTLTENKNKLEERYNEAVMLNNAAKSLYPDIVSNKENADKAHDEALAKYNNAKSVLDNANLAYKAQEDAKKHTKTNNTNITSSSSTTSTVSTKPSLPHTGINNNTSILGAIAILSGLVTLFVVKKKEIK